MQSHQLPENERFMVEYHDALSRVCFCQSLQIVTYKFFTKKKAAICGCSVHIEPDMNVNMQEK